MAGILNSIMVQAVTATLRLSCVLGHVVVTLVTVCVSVVVQALLLCRRCCCCLIIYSLRRHLSGVWPSLLQKRELAMQWPTGTALAVEGGIPRGKDCEWWIPCLPGGKVAREEGQGELILDGGAAFAIARLRSLTSFSSLSAMNSLACCGLIFIQQLASGSLISM